MDKPARQTVRYLHTVDGVHLAWAEAGSGPVWVKAANWLTHLEYDWQSPVWRHWIRFLADQFHFVRYDERGCGLSDRIVSDVSHEHKVADLEAVTDAAAPGAPVTLLGISQGAPVCVDYAVRHPERVSRLVGGLQTCHRGQRMGVFAERGGAPGAKDDKHHVAGTPGDDLHAQRQLWLEHERIGQKRK